MTDVDCVEFLQWALPQLHLRWQGFKRVRRQVCRRIDRRRATLGLGDLAAYRRLLAERPEEWAVLDQLCRVTISRFARDRGVWTALVDKVLPRLADEAAAAGRPSMRAWSAGCGAGEEPYTLAIAWALAIAPRWPGIAIDIRATDIDDYQLGRAATASYPTGTLRELPDDWRGVAFETVAGEERLAERFRTPVRFVREDIRAPVAGDPFNLVLCRNLAFTYFAEPVQLEIAASLRAALRPGGALVIGIHERLPEGTTGFAPLARCIYLAVSS